MKKGREVYQAPLCSTIRLEHREFIAVSTMVILTTDEAASGVPVAIEDLSYDAF